MAKRASMANGNGYFAVEFEVSQRREIRRSHRAIPAAALHAGHVFDLIEAKPAPRTATATASNPETRHGRHTSENQPMRMANQLERFAETRNRLFHADKIEKRVASTIQAAENIVELGQGDIKTRC